MKRIVLHEGKFKRLVSENEWEFVERINCSGIAVILAVTPEGKLLLVEQYRIPVRRKVIEFPAGLASDAHWNRGESLINAAKRELLEETGYEAESMSLVLSGPTASATTPDIMTLFRAEGLRKVSRGGGDGTEAITVHEVELNGIRDWIKGKETEGVLVDPKIYAGLYLLGGSGKGLLAGLIS